MLERLRYAWLGSGPKWAGWRLQVLGGLCAGSLYALSSGFGLKLPPTINDNPILSNVVSFVAAGLVGGIIVFSLRWIYWPLHCWARPFGGLIAALNRIVLAAGELEKNRRLEAQLEAATEMIRKQNAAVAEYRSHRMNAHFDARNRAADKGQELWLDQDPSKPKEMCAKLKPVIEEMHYRYKEILALSSLAMRDDWKAAENEMTLKYYDGEPAAHNNPHPCEASWLLARYQGNLLARLRSEGRL